jgi:predicted DCC family thiol-disulfide oxidoreductase YuxK
VLELRSSETTNPIILYDGVCGLCNRLNQFVLKYDKGDIFRFAPLQSRLAAEILGRHGIQAGDLDTVYVVQRSAQPDEQLLSRSDAVICVLSHLGAGWRFVGFISRLLPLSFRNWVYTLIARNRYQLFGKSDSCLMPSAKDRAKFLDLA